MGQQPNDPKVLNTEHEPSSPPNSSPQNESSEIIKKIDNRLRGEVQLPLSQQTKITRIISQVIREESFSFSGPQPPPQLLAQYEQVCPGWGTRLLQMGLDEQSHRHACEKEMLAQTKGALTLDSQEATYAMTGLVLGFIAFLVIAALGVYALHLGYEKTAIALFGTFAIGIVGNFIKGRDKAGRDSQGNSKQSKSKKRR